MAGVSDLSVFAHEEIFPRNFRSFKIRDLYVEEH